MDPRRHHDYLLRMQAVEGTQEATGTAPGKAQCLPLRRTAVRASAPALNEDEWPLPGRRSLTISASSVTESAPQSYMRSWLEACGSRPKSKLVRRPAGPKQH
jgi:hypothetical protein